MAEYKIQCKSYNGFEQYRIMKKLSFGIIFGKSIWIDACGFVFSTQEMAQAHLEYLRFQEQEWKDKKEGTKCEH